VRRGNGLGGGGYEYYLNRTAAGWCIVSRSAWMSMRPGRPDYERNAKL